MLRTVIEDYSKPDAWQIERFRNFYALEHEANLILSAIQKFSFERVLDIGCGRGRFCVPLAKHNRTKQIVSVDASPVMVEVVT